jgi:hypothetical protein
LNQISSTSQQDSDMNFTWICPNLINNFCQNQHNSTLTLAYDQYKDLVSDSNNNETLLEEFTLILSKDNRQAEKSFNITILVSNSNDLKDKIMITQLTNGANQEDIIFSIVILDNNLNISDYNFTWTILNLDGNSYLNGRNENTLRISYDDLSNNQNVIELYINNKNNSENATIQYIYNKTPPPYNGICTVTPSIGISYETNFTFDTKGWISDNLPLVYEIIFIDSNGFEFPLTNGYSMSTNFTSNLIPPGNNFILKIKDSSGLISYSTFNVQVNNNPNNYTFNDYIQNVLDPNQMNLALKVYIANFGMNHTNVVNYSISLLNESLNNNINNNIYNSVAIKENFQRIISLSSDILSQKLSSTQNSLMQNLVENIVINIQQNMNQNKESIMNNQTDISKVYYLIDQLITQSVSPSENDLGFNQYDLDQVLNAMNLLDIFTDLVLDNISSGQEFYYVNENINIQLNKISNNYVRNITINPDNSITYNCLSSSIVCIDQSYIQDIFSESNYTTLDLRAYYFKNKYLPIHQNDSNYVFSLDSLYINLTGAYEYELIQQTNGIVTFPFLINLNIPKITSGNLSINYPQTTNDTVNNTACLYYYDNTHYSSSPNNTACRSWYDYNNYKTICQCTKPGLISSIYNKVETNFSKFAQFPLLIVGYCKIFY